MKLQGIFQVATEPEGLRTFVLAVRGKMLTAEEDPT
jgi:hypothetical protein